MENLGSRERLCHLVGVLRSRRKGSLMLYGFGVIFGASILLFAAIVFLFPVNSPSIITPMLKFNLKRFYTKFPFSRLPGYINTYGGGCNIFEGEWVRVNDRKPYYLPGSCPFIEVPSNFDCYRNGKPDDAYLKWQWKWQSHPTNAGCNNNVPSALNASDFLERLRGKKVAFAGDSLNRNMFESLACILWNAVPDKSRVFWLGNVENNIREQMSVRYEDYNCTIGFVWSPFLVYETQAKSRRMQESILKQVPETMRLDMIDPRASVFYRDADIVIFDSWHWWVRNKVHNRTNYFQEGDHLYPKMEIRSAYKKALTTWRRWVDKNINSNKTQVVFRGHSVSHFRRDGKCNREGVPITSNETYREKNPPRVKILEETLRRMKTPVIYLNVTKQTYYRADAHPALYTRFYNGSIANEAMKQDCGHWCLPGVPDTWNELLYISLLKAGKASFAG
ncbi:protein trichome birefringence-like 2 isoform X1 [Papaver somniferum]|uniref:protein trichome birefringence-like 2 isoform X1 n=1 Tax=Papaver somniferum TaxID=3469 RepID=UPI000E6F8C3F|nr:protein trichome birefringence-like 2 isoform X1 [Papaver somniferum]